MTTAARPHFNEEAADVMGQILDGFTEYVSRSETKAAGARKYRASLLWVHAVAALAMAPAFAALGRDGMAGGSWTFLRQLPAMPTSLAVLLFIGGLVLGFGSVTQSKRLEVAGLALLSTFYLVICIGFGLAVLAFYTGDITSKPAPYAPILYLHMTTILVVHIGTLTRQILNAPKG